jgi:hypothetical protein
MDDGAFETELDAYRDRVEKPLWRLFKRYGRGEWRWLAVGLVTSVFTYGALLERPGRRGGGPTRGVRRAGLSQSVGGR